MQNRNVQELSSQLEKNQERLRSSEARIRTLLKTIPVGLFITDPIGVIESASPAALELFRCNYPDLHSRKLEDLFVLPVPMPGAIEMLSSSESKELIARRPDGSEFPASIKLSTFAGSNVPGLLVVFEDVTAKHELEQMKQEFLSMMTHDLRTPLSSLNCFLELVAAGIYDDKQDELKERSKRIIDTTTRLINMINSLLNLHKLEAGRLDLSIEATPVASIVDQSLESLVSLAESKEIPLSVTPTSPDLMVSADEGYTVQVLVNLLSNALKFSDKGSPVSIVVDEQPERVMITVRDKGRGIPKEFQSRLFNRFEQARISDARVLGGSGLGLAISKAIVEQQGGNIGVVSEPGKGCDFWFTLRRI